MKRLLTCLLLASTLKAFAEVPADAVWIDVRTAQEFNAGHVAGAVRIPWGGIEKGVAELGLEKDRPIYLYCGAGGRAGRAQETLQAAGYTATVNAGGLDDARQLAGEN
ncbi:MAG: rhodanese-like domain-containing protein [Pseudomonadota bacterium]